MVVAFETGGDVLSALLLFIVFGWAVYGMRGLFGLRARIALGLYAWHSFWTVGYIAYSLAVGSDSIGYYEASLNIYEDFRVGTMAVTYLTSIFSSVFGLSFAGVFTAFNFFGTVGMLAIASVVNNMRPHILPIAARIAPIVYLMPGASYWTGSIGKDALSFLAVGLTAWGAVKFPQRAVALAVAVAAMIFVRPHIAVLLLAAIAGAVIIASRASLALRLALSIIAIAGGVVLTQFALEYVGLESATGTGDFIDYVEQRQVSNIEGGSSIDLVGISWPVRILTYMYRPLFIDAGSTLGFGVSVENLVITLISVAALVAFVIGRRSILPFFSWLVFTIYTVASWALLANTTANLGLATRQKYMILPLFLIILLSYLVPERRRSTGPA